MDQLLRIEDIEKILGLSQSTISRLEKRGLFPKRRIIGKRCICWFKSEVEDWLNQRLAKSANQ